MKNEQHLEQHSKLPAPQKRTAQKLSFRCSVNRLKSWNHFIRHKNNTTGKLSNTATSPKFDEWNHFPSIASFQFVNIGEDKFYRNYQFDIGFPYKHCVWRHVYPDNPLRAKWFIYSHVSSSTAVLILHLLSGSRIDKLCVESCIGPNISKHPK